MTWPNLLYISNQVTTIVYLQSIDVKYKILIKEGTKVTGCENKGKGTIKCSCKCGYTGKLCEVKCDVTRAATQLELFDHYYDTYKNVQGISWTKGIVSPRTWDGGSKPTPPKKRKKKS